MNRFAVASSAAFVFLVACSNGGGIPQSQSSQIDEASRSAPNSITASTSGAFGHLYTLGVSGEEEIAEYNLPLTTNPTPVVTLPFNNTGVCDPVVNAAKLYIACFGVNESALYVYSLPLTSGEGPSLIDPSFAARSIAVNNGTLYAFPYPTTKATIKAYALPYTKGEAPSTVVTTTSSQIPYGHFLMTAGSQFLNVALRTPTETELQSFALPLVAGESPSRTAILFDTHRVVITQSTDKLYVHVAFGNIDFYQLPLPSSRTTDVITQAFTEDQLAADEHYLYAADLGNAQLRVYKLPFIASGSYDRMFKTVYNVTLSYNGGIALGP